MTNADYADDLTLLTNTPAKPKHCCIAWSKQ